MPTGARFSVSYRRVDVSSIACVTFVCAASRQVSQYFSSWAGLGFRMDALMFVFLAIASFSAVVVHSQGWFAIDPGILGLALSMLIQLSGL